MTVYHGQAADLPHGRVELPEVQWLLAHSGKVCDRCAPLFHEVEVSLHPAPPLRLHAQLKQPRDSLPAEGARVGVGFLGSDGEKGWKYNDILFLLIHIFMRLTDFLIYRFVLSLFPAPTHSYTPDRRRVLFPVLTLTFIHSTFASLRFKSSGRRHVWLQKRFSFT